MSSHGCIVAFPAFPFPIPIVQLDIPSPRKYEVVHLEQNRQDKWTVETRSRKSGKLEGSTYKVWTSPNGSKYYSLKKAIEGGFDNSEISNPGDGENAADKKTKPKGSRGKKCVKAVKA